MISFYSNISGSIEPLNYNNNNAHNKNNIITSSNNNNNSHDDNNLFNEYVITMIVASM